MSAIASNVNVTSKEIVKEDIKKKIEERVNPVQYYVKYSFSITYILLLTTATITFIEAMRTKNATVRHVLNLETCISVVAGYFYSNFVDKINAYDKEDKQINWADITSTRYIDWSITTPLMLLTLCLVLGQNIGRELHVGTIGAIVVLNYMMLYLGYLGETGDLTRIFAMIGGFIPFFAMFYLIYINFVKPKNMLANNILFGIYFIVWSLYGVVYMLPEVYKNIIMNALDCTAKCLIGLGLWAYYSKIMVL